MALQKLAHANDAIYTGFFSDVIIEVLIFFAQHIVGSRSNCLTEGG